MTFGGALNFYKRAGIVHDHIHVGLGGRIFGIIEINYGRAGEDAYRYGGHHAIQWIFDYPLLREQDTYGIMQSYISAIDSGGTSAAIGLQDVAVDDYRAFTKRLAIKC